jgi:hypothetical protein
MNYSRLVVGVDKFGSCQFAVCSETLVMVRS